MPIIFFTAMNNLIWAIGLEVTLSVLGFSDINRPSVGGMIYWANAALGDGVRHLVVDRLSDDLRRHRCSSACSCWPCRSTSTSTRAAGSPGWERDVQQAPAGQVAAVTEPDGREHADHRSAQGLLHQRALWGQREVRAVDDVSLVVRRNEIYGLAGESSSGKTSLIKTLAGAIRPPMRVIDGSVTFNFGGESVDVYRQPDKMRQARWRHLSYIMQGSMNVLNPVRRVKHSFRDFAFRHMDSAGDFQRACRSGICSGCSSIPACWRRSRTSCPAACASG